MALLMGRIYAIRSWWRRFRFIVEQECLISSMGFLLCFRLVNFSKIMIDLSVVYTVNSAYTDIAMPCTVPRLAKGRDRERSQ